MKCLLGIILWMFLTGCAGNAIMPDQPEGSQGQVDWSRINIDDAGLAGISTIPGMEYSVLIYKAWKNSQQELQGEAE